MDQGRGRVIVVGNEKGGSGKSTIAMHLIVALLRLGHSVTGIDLDTRQRTLTRYVENRRAYAARHGINLPVADHAVFIPQKDAEEAQWLASRLPQLVTANDFVIIDSLGADTALSRLGHSYADILITPINDSFVDLDVIAHVDGETMKVAGPSHYAEMIWEQKKTRAKRDGGSIDWIVMRNRLSSLDALNKRDMERVLHGLSGRLGFRVFSGFGERVVYRELFLKGLTMMDLREVAGEEDLNISHITARQEVRNLVEAVKPRTRR